MSKVHLLSQIITNLQQETSQQGKYDILHQYEKEAILKRVISIAYNPWINLEMKNFEPRRMGKKFGMSIPKFLHIIDDMIDDKFTQKEKEFSCQMAMMHILPFRIIINTILYHMHISATGPLWPERSV